MKNYCGPDDMSPDTICSILKI